MNVNKLNYLWMIQIELAQVLPLLALGGVEWSASLLGFFTP
jgi:hypothetical protein